MNAKITCEGKLLQKYCSVTAAAYCCNLSAQGILAEFPEFVDSFPVCPTNNVMLFRKHYSLISPSFNPKFVTTDISDVEQVFKNIIRK